MAAEHSDGRSDVGFWSTEWHSTPSLHMDVPFAMDDWRSTLALLDVAQDRGAKLGLSK